VIGTASWDDALRLLERACTLEPDRTVHLLALGEAYRDVGRKDAARRTLAAAVAAPLTDPNDELYRRMAREALSALR
jgi:regulator of sirC expression with transglutaminase-like and TPR domain